MQLHTLTWKQAQQAINKDTLAIIPLGSMEQHGPIGPVGTDYVLAQDFALRVDAHLDNVVTLPPMPYGICPYHMHFNGTIDIGLDALTAVIRGITGSLYQHGIRKFVFMNGHGGNNPAIDRVALEMYAKGCISATLEWWTIAPQLNPAWAGGHGGSVEASVVKYLHPEMIDLANLFPTENIQLSDALPNDYLTNVKFRGVTVKVLREIHHITTNGGGGGTDSSEKTDSAWGKEMCDQITDFMVAFIKEFSAVKRA